MTTYPTPYRPQPSPPVENGVRLATFARGRDTELRVNLATYEGRPYVSLRVWERGSDGQLWPQKGKGCSVRLNEIEGMVEALRQVGGMVAAPGPDRRQDRPASRGTSWSGPQPQRSLPAPRAAADPPFTPTRGGPLDVPFDEFD